LCASTTDHASNHLYVLCNEVPNLINLNYIPGIFSEDGKIQKHQKVLSMIEDNMNQTATLKDGRNLGFAEYGDPAGKVVFHFNGSGGSHLEHPANQSILTDLGIRFIATDRPGHGLSDPQPDRQLLDWPDDIIINSPWYINFKEIKVRIDIWHGEVDKNVPLNQGQYQHELIPNSHLTILPDQAHLYLLSHWGEVLVMLTE
jgi:pimeloyl-ACP methyl ester carboxylesterase